MNALKIHLAQYTVQERISVDTATFNEGTEQPRKEDVVT